MAYRKFSYDEAKIARLIKEGRGQGRGADYLPWITIHDFPSHGRSHRAFSLKTGRQHHLLSDIEWRMFLHLDWCEAVLDIREQFPLERSATRRIAEQMGVRHPTDTASQTPLVMTTDYLVNVLRDGKNQLEACAIKPASHLEKPRVIEKLEIERRVWSEQGVVWRVFTELDFDPIITKNLQWLRSLNFDLQDEPWPGFHRDHAQAVRTAIPRANDLTLRQFCIQTDHALALEPGSSLTVMRHLLLAKLVGVDLTQPLNDDRRMSDFRLIAAQAGREVG